MHSGPAPHRPLCPAHSGSKPRRLPEPLHRRTLQMSNRLVKILLERKGGTAEQPLFRENFLFESPSGLELPSSLKFLKRDFSSKLHAIPAGTDMEVFLHPNAAHFRDVALQLRDHLAEHKLFIKGSDGVHILGVRVKSDGRIVMKLRMEPHVTTAHRPADSAPGSMQSSGAGSAKRDRDAGHSEKKRIPPHLRGEPNDGGSGGPPPPPPPLAPHGPQAIVPSAQSVNFKGTLGQPLPNVVANFVLLRQTQVSGPLCIGLASLPPPSPPAWYHPPAFSLGF